jgi:uncharacterized C2H2 Zn-finger protein
MENDDGRRKQKRNQTNDDEIGFHCLDSSCGKVFDSSQGLRSHMRSRSHERLYSCVQCDKVFFSSLAREEHTSSAEHKQRGKQRRINKLEMVSP